MCRLNRIQLKRACRADFLWNDLAPCFGGWITKLTEKIIPFRWKSQYGLLTLIHWIAIYPLANSISPFNFWTLLDDLEAMRNQEKDDFEEMHGYF